MRLISVRGLLICLAVSAAGLMAPSAQAQCSSFLPYPCVYGSSSIVATTSVVNSTSYTEIDYTTSYNYGVETDGYLSSGPSGSSSGSLTLTSSASPGGTYWVQTNHWVIASGSDPDGFGGISSNYYSGSFVAYGTRTAGAGGTFWVGTSWATVVAPQVYPPSINSAYLWSSATGQAGTDGYYILSGTNFVGTPGDTQASIDGVSASVSYAVPTQVNVYFSIPLSAYVGTHTLTLSTSYGSTSTGFYVSPAPMQSQTITFNSLGNVTLGVSPFTVSASASSGLGVSFSSGSAGICAVSGATVSISGVGTCSITASQSGNSSWYAASNVTQSFAVLSPPLTAQLTDLSQSGTYYLVGDSYQVTVTGPPNQPVTLSQNGGSPVPVVNPQGSSSTSSLGVWTTTGTWSAAGSYTQTYYVAGVQIPGAFQFQVSAVPTCAAVHASDVPQGTAEQLSVSVPPSGMTLRVLFSIVGSNVNVYSGSVSASLNSNSTSTWTAQVDTSTLLGEYQATPSVQLLNANGSVAASRPCTGSVVFFNVQKAVPPIPGQAKCASMTGTWTATDTNEVNKSWSIVDTHGNLGGSMAFVGACGVTVSYSTVSGSYNSASGQYSLSATGPSPGVYNCAGYTWVASNYSVNGTVSAGACGVGSGSYSDYLYTGLAETLRTERAPTGETTVFAGWGDIYGSPTSAAFNATLNVSPNGPAYNFGGRKVTQGVPASPAGSDTCWWSGNSNTLPGYTSPITKLATPGDGWYIQDDQKSGAYGPDYLGMTDTFIAMLQQRAPALSSPTSSCTIQFPQQMSINTESATTGSDPPYSTNMLIFTFTQTTVVISRSGVADPAGARAVHF